ncbi:MAG TPA: c-type cytochrome [Terracidiphilus sp.]|jgi:mono/diheme cytochrome c family protein|nr:c-type cytochrome [Terracidiphilus sp.]
MFKYLSLLAIASIAILGIAQQPKDKVIIPVHPTSATNGKQMYANYCASCHGMDGKGQGPVASVLTTAPTNLTFLSKKNDGKFPDTHIAAILEFGIETPAHGNAEMPVWGPILGKMNRANSQERQLRISNLCRYLESIQAK